MLQLFIDQIFGFIHNNENFSISMLVYSYLMEQIIILNKLKHCVFMSPVTSYNQFLFII